MHLVAPQRRFGMRFPTNGASPAGVGVSFQFLSPQTNGLPIWGPSNNGVVYLWRAFYMPQASYFTTFFWGDNASFFWNLGNPDTYYGAHPYPVTPPNSTNHYWEIAIEGGDTTNTLAGGPKTVEKMRWFTQGLRVEYNGGTKRLRYYLNLPSLATSDIIEHVTAAGYGETNPPNAALRWADAGWNAGNERLNGVLGGAKVIAHRGDDNLQDMLAESMNWNQMVTAWGRTNVWYFKSSFRGNGDLACELTGNTPTWVDTNNRGSVEWVDTPDQYERIGYGHGRRVALR